MLDQAGYTRVNRLDLRPDRLDAEVPKGRRVRRVQVRADGALDRGTATPAGVAGATLALSAVDPAAPARLVRGSAKRYRVRPGGINYLIASPESQPGDHHWRAYFKNGIYVEGDAKGRVIRRFDGG